jgi:hypothetical protein
VWDEAVSERVLYLIGQGHRVEALRRVDPAMPGRPVIERWRRARPDFDFDFRVNALMGRLARRRAERHALLETVEARLLSVGSLKRLGGRNGLPRAATLYAWVRRDRAFAERVRFAREFHRELLLDRAWALVRIDEGLSAAELRRGLAPLTRRVGQLAPRGGGWRPDPAGLPAAWPMPRARWRKRSTARPAGGR